MENLADFSHPELNMLKWDLTLIMAIKHRNGLLTRNLEAHSGLETKILPKRGKLSLRPKKTFALNDETYILIHFNKDLLVANADSLFDPTTLTPLYPVNMPGVSNTNGCQGNSCHWLNFFSSKVFDELWRMSCMFYPNHWWVLKRLFLSRPYSKPIWLLNWYWIYESKYFIPRNRRSRKWERLGESYWRYCKTNSVFIW